MKRGTRSAERGMKISPPPYVVGYNVRTPPNPGRNTTRSRRRGRSSVALQSCEQLAPGAAQESYATTLPPGQQAAGSSEGGILVWRWKLNVKS